jgi:16S rRNA pseudouridine516 synthase
MVARMKLLRLLSNLGYGSRSTCRDLLRAGRVRDSAGKVLGENDGTAHGEVRVDGSPLDPPFPLLIALHKPEGFTCSTEDPGATVFDLLPARFAARKPGLHPVGRLDKDTSGLLLLTDDGAFAHRVIHPKSGCSKTYEVLLERPLEGHEGEWFASGTVMLRGETKPLLPALLEVGGPCAARITIREGRYHQVRRMFAAAGNHVRSLRRVSIGALPLPADLPEGEWRVLGEEDRQRVLAKD